MKLYLTLDNEKGNKIERVYQVNEDNSSNHKSWGEIVEDIFDSMNTPFIEDTKVDVPSEIDEDMAIKTMKEGKVGEPLQTEIK